MCLGEIKRKLYEILEWLPPLLRYNKYYGLLYNGCPGEKPCDDLDACCIYHDKCVQVKNNGFYFYTSIIYCIQTFYTMLDLISKYIIYLTS